MRTAGTALRVGPGRFVNAHNDLTIRLTIRLTRAIRALRTPGTGRAGDLRESPGLLTIRLTICLTKWTGRDGTGLDNRTGVRHLGTDGRKTALTRTTRADPLMTCKCWPRSQFRCDTGRRVHVLRCGASRSATTSARSAVCPVRLHQERPGGAAAGRTTGEPAARLSPKLLVQRRCGGLRPDVQSASFRDGSPTAYGGQPDPAGSVLCAQVQRLRRPDDGRPDGPTSFVRSAQRRCVSQPEQRDFGCASASHEGACWPRGRARRRRKPAPDCPGRPRTASAGGCTRDGGPALLRGTIR